MSNNKMYHYLVRISVTDRWNVLQSINIIFVRLRCILLTGARFGRVSCDSTEKPSLRRGQA